MTIGAYLLDLINEAEDSEFNILILGEDCMQDVAIAGQFFPSCAVYSAELLDEDIDQLRSMNISFGYVVVTYLIDRDERWNLLIKVSALIDKKGVMIIACPNSNTIDKITDLMKYRIGRLSEPALNYERLLDDGIPNTDCSAIDIADRITEMGFIIDKFGLFGEPLESDLNKDVLTRQLGDDYTDSINALFIPYIRLFLKSKTAYSYRENSFPDACDGVEGYIREVNTFNMYNLVLRKNIQDRNYFMKNLMPISKKINFDKDANEILKNKILEGKPFCALRLGNTEGILIDNYISNVLEEQKGYSGFAIDYALNTGGFFVSNDSDTEKVLNYFDDFVRLQLDGFKNADIMMMWGACRMEENSRELVR